MSGIKTGKRMKNKKVLIQIWQVDDSECFRRYFVIRCAIVIDKRYGKRRNMRLFVRFLYFVMRFLREYSVNSL